MTESAKEYIVEDRSTSGGWHWPEKVQRLIRCKDCVNHRDRAGICDVWHHHTGAMGYCHRARHK